MVPGLRGIMAADAPGTAAPIAHTVARGFIDVIICSFKGSSCFCSIVKMSVDIEQKLTSVIKPRGDIDEHLIHLMKLASDCESILECGVRSIVSSWAFVNGLTINKSAKKRLVCSDIDPAPGAQELAAACAANGIEHKFIVGNDLDMDMEHHDMIFIDTWHIYGHLRRELAKMHPYAKKYIVMHDTEIDKILGESIRCGSNIQQQAAKSGYSVEEITCGLGRAIDEFIMSHPEWRVKKHFTHENGLTVLERV